MKLDSRSFSFKRVLLGTIGGTILLIIVPLVVAGFVYPFVVKDRFERQLQETLSTYSASVVLGPLEGSFLPKEVIEQGETLDTKSIEVQGTLTVRVETFGDSVSGLGGAIFYPGFETWYGFGRAFLYVNGTTPNIVGFSRNGPVGEVVVQGVYDHKNRTLWIPQSCEECVTFTGPASVAGSGLR